MFNPDRYMSILKMQSSSGNDFSIKPKDSTKSVPFGENICVFVFYFLYRTLIWSVLIGVFIHKNKYKVLYNIGIAFNHSLWGSLYLICPS